MPSVRRSHATASVIGFTGQIHAHRARPPQSEQTPSMTSAPVTAAPASRLPAANDWDSTNGVPEQQAVEPDAGRERPLHDRDAAPGSRRKQREDPELDRAPAHEPTVAPKETRRHRGNTRIEAVAVRHACSQLPQPVHATARTVGSYLVTRPPQPAGSNVSASPRSGQAIQQARQRAAAV
jgi:hypothetical protein